MTPKDVQAALEAIQQAADSGDYEVAHMLEDNLCRRVLFYIAEQPRREPLADTSKRVYFIELARLAMCSTNIKFDRHCVVT